MKYNNIFIFLLTVSLLQLKNLSAEEKVVTVSGTVTDAVTGLVRSATRAIEGNGTVIVHPGSYLESLEVKIIHEGVLLQGTETENTIIGFIVYSTISIEAEKPTIEYLQIASATYRAILAYRNGDQRIIRNNIIRGGSDGVEARNDGSIDIGADE